MPHFLESTLNIIKNWPSGREENVTAFKAKKRFNHSFTHSAHQPASQIFIHPFFNSHLLQGMKIALQNLIFKPHYLH